MTGASAAPLTATDVVARVFPEGQAIANSRHRENCSIHVISQGIEPRWIIMGKPTKALPVLMSWAPWKASSRLRWKAVQMAAAVNALPMMPGVQNSSVKVDMSYWRGLLHFSNDWSAVIHVGNPSHTRKAILFLIEGGRRVVCAAKVPLVSGAAGAIVNEAEILDLLRRFECLPRVLFKDRGQGIVAQSWLVGKPVSRGFTQAHVNLLNSLVLDADSVRVSDYIGELATGLAGCDLPFDRSVLARGLDMLDCDLPLRPFVEHRDFASWNLKWIRRGTLGLLDWEWAIPSGLPWQDACRYFYIEDAHFHGSGRVWQSLSSDQLLAQHRRDCDIPDDALPALTMRYLLRELLMEWDGGNPWLASYAYKQIESLLNSLSLVRVRI